MFGPALERGGEFVGVGLVKVFRERASRESADRCAGHRGDIGDGAGDRLAGDEVEGCALFEVAILDDLIDGEKAIGIADADDSAVITGAGEDVREPGSEVCRAGCDGGKEGGFVQRGRVASSSQLTAFSSQPEGRGAGWRGYRVRAAVTLRSLPLRSSVTGKATSQPRAVAFSVRAKR